MVSARVAATALPSKASFVAKKLMVSTHSSSSRQLVFSTWKRWALASVIVLPNCLHAQQAGSTECQVSRLRPEAGLFALRIGESTIGLPSSLSALQRTEARDVAAVIVPTEMRAAAVASALPGGVRQLPADISHSGSALVKASAALSVQNVSWNRSSISIVSNRAADRSQPVAAMVVDRSQWRSTRVSLVSLALSDAPGPAELEIATLEQLYTMAFREEAGAGFCLQTDASSCEDDRLLEQAQALQKIAALRQCAMTKLLESERAKLPTWRVVVLHPYPATSDPKATVSARVSDPTGPLAGVQVMFSKAPHSACTAVSSADGTASCVLVDEHGHGAHPEFDREPVVATFPGDLRRSPFLLPTTKLLPVAP